jgi:hypothetical protein
MATDLLSLQLAFRALSDAPDGDEDDIDTGSADEELEDDEETEEDEDPATTGFGTEEPSDEGTE